MYIQGKGPTRLTAKRCNVGRQWTEVKQRVFTSSRQVTGNRCWRPDALEVSSRGPFWGGMHWERWCGGQPSAQLACKWQYHQHAVRRIRWMGVSLQHLSYRLPCVQLRLLCFATADDMCLVLDGFCQEIWTQSGNTVVNPKRAEVLQWLAGDKPQLCRTNKPCPSLIRAHLPYIVALQWHRKSFSVPKIERAAG